jgi:tetratricopeptide (TPR) repeat protein
MTLSFKSITFWFFFLAPLTAGALTPADTSSKKSPLQMVAPGYRLSDYTMLLKDAIASFKQDSVDKGMALLSKTIKNIRSQRDAKRIMPYQGYEVISLIEDINNSNLSPAENQLGKAFFKIIFTSQPNDKSADNIWDGLLKNASNTVFTQRLKLLTASLKGKSTTGPELNRLLNVSPGLVSANIMQAEALFDKHKYQECINYCNKTIVAWPQYAHAYHVRAKCYTKLDQPENAIADYDKAIQFFPGYFVFYYDRSDCLIDLEKYREAATDLRLTLRLKPNYNWTYYNLTRCYKNINMPDSALYFINQHISENADDGDGYNLKGDIYYERDEYETAITLYTQAINLEPQKRTFYVDRGDAYYYSDKLDDAIKDFQKAISIDQSYPYPYDRIGDCFYKKKQYETAITYHQKAIKANPEYKYAYVGLNLSYTQSGKYQEAIDAAKKAVAIDSTYANALGNLGWSCYCAGKFDDCIKYSYKALKYEPDATYAMFNIALATLAKGEIEKANQLYTSFLKTCKEKNYEIRDGATDDLRELIKKKVHVKESKFIIEHIFGQKAE